MHKPLQHRPVALVVLDGWGHREQADCNAIRNAHTPVWDRLWRSCPHTLIRTSGAAAGLPADQMGNSEVGHLNLGAGRVVYQEFTRVSRAIRTGWRCNVVHRISTYMLSWTAGILPPRAPHNPSTA